MKRTVVLMALICLASLSANAQIFKKHSSDADKTESKFVWQADLYLQDKWGVGFTVRKETSPYFGWNLIGASYMSGWYKNECPKNFSIINVRLMGLRFQIPIYKNLKFYAEGTPGYTYRYRRTKYRDYNWGYYVTKTKTDKSHCLGIDCGAGFQVLKNVSIGYNYTFLATFNSDSDKYHIHWGRISVLF